MDNGLISCVQLWKVSCRDCVNEWGSCPKARMDGVAVEMVTLGLMKKSLCSH